MKLRISAFAAVLLCCMSCVSTNNRLGGSLVPLGQTYDIFVNDSLYLPEVYMEMADSLSGFSQTRMTIGSVRDKDYGLTTRGCALTLVPMISGEDTLLFGKNPKFQSFHFAASYDSCSVNRLDQLNILQNIYVHPLTERLDPNKNFDTNSEVKYGSSLLTQGVPIFNGQDSLSFNFSKEFGEQFFTMTKEDVRSIKKYTEKFPGIYLETEEPNGEGGRINIFDLQLSYNSSYYSIEGNYAKLNFEAEFDGERKDSCMYFYYSPTKFYDVDSLLTYGTVGEYPQYCLNLTGHQTRSKAGKAKDKITIEGGGGLKPVISALLLKQLAEETISKNGGNPKEAIINKATLVFPFEFPEDYTEVDNFWPDIMSPTTRVINNGVVSYMGLTDSSSSSENQGDINRSLFRYAPDITYHLQELLNIDLTKTSDTKTKKLLNGEYDIWLLIMANEIITTTSSASSEMSDYYNYLAYQSYYNEMYGGYGGYGGYGYGGYGGYGDYYSNYYSYMMMAQYANQSSTYSSVSVMLDKDRFYKATINGPEFPHKGRTPRLELTYSLPK